MSDVTRLLDAAAAGDGRATADLLPLVYDELRQLAAARLAREKPGQTLDATALVHEAYLRLVVAAKPQAVEFANRRHFFAAAAEAMRRILIDRARQRSSQKHGGGRRRVPLADLAHVADTPDGLIAVDEALERLAAEEPQKADLVKLRFFAGMTMPEAAVVLNVSLATAERWWAYSKAWLYAALADAE